MGATRFQTIVVKSQAMLSLDQVRPFLTTDRSASSRPRLSMLGHILWDNDFVPIDNCASTFTWARRTCPSNTMRCAHQIAAVLKDHPQFSARFATVLDAVTASIHISINAYGSPQGLSALCGCD